MGRSRDVGDERYATVTETAEALIPPVTPQAIYNRIKADTIPYEQHIDESTGRPRYLIPRDWLDAEVERGQRMSEDTHQLNKQMSDRTEEVLLVFAEGVETIRQEVEKQHTQLLPLQRKQLENQTKMLGEIAGMKNALDEFFKLARRLDARLDERERVERNFQQNNLELGRELRDLQQKSLELFEGMKREADALKGERLKRGEEEKRSLWRRIFGGD